MSDQIRAAQLLRQAADALLSNRSTCTNTCTTTTTTTTTAAAVRSIFMPYRTPGAGVINRNRRSLGPLPSYWLHRFCALSRSSMETVPTREEKQRLFQTGLGEKKVTFVKDDSAENFRTKLEDVYPKLRKCGGFELLRTGLSSRVTLERIPMPATGYTSNYLADSSNVGQALCYIRPIQNNLDDTQNDVDVQVSDTLKQECFKCREDIPLINLREHPKVCGAILVDADDSDDIPHPKKKRKMSVQVPICQYACQEIETSTEDPKEIKFGTCPICNTEMRVDDLQEHADMCADLTEKEINNATRGSTLKDALRCEYEKGDDKWNVRVIRKHFLRTSMEQLSGGLDEDWGKKLEVHFIGEEGIDHGGLMREFFSLLFRETPIFEDGSFSLRSELLNKNTYKLLGKTTAMAILCGHPGPKCLSEHLVDYILQEQIPDFSSISTEMLGRLDAVAAITEIRALSNPDEVNIRYADLLEAAGFTSQVNTGNREAACLAIKGYYLFYRCLPSLLQFMEGMKHRGVLSLLRKFLNEAKRCLMKGIHPTACEVMDAFCPSYSNKQEEKDIEELVVYNFNNFVQKLERGQITSPWLDFEKNTEDTCLHMGHLLQALVGCPSLPANLSGLIYFDHDSKNISTVNTCAPSIQFSDLHEIQNYSKFEEHLIHIKIGSYGFGIV